MIQEIGNRRSIRKYKEDKISKKLLEEIIYSATLAPSAKNRQPWKFIVYQGKEKEKLVDIMRQGINSEKVTHTLMPEWAFAIPDAENTVRIMQEAPAKRPRKPLLNLEMDQSANDRPLKRSTIKSMTIFYQFLRISTFTVNSLSVSIRCKFSLKAR